MQVAAEEGGAGEEGNARDDPERDPVVHGHAGDERAPERGDDAQAHEGYVDRAAYLGRQHPFFNLLLLLPRRHGPRLCWRLGVLCTPR